MVKTIDATTTDRLRRSPLFSDLSPSCARKRACMELTTICRFQRLKIPLFDFFSAFEVSRSYRVWFFAKRLFLYVFVSAPPCIYPLSPNNELGE